MRVHINDLQMLMLLFLPANIVMDNTQNRSKGYGFVTFAKEDDAHRALIDMNGKVILHFHFSKTLWISNDNKIPCSYSMDELFLWTKYDPQGTIEIVGQEQENPLTQQMIELILICLPLETSICYDDKKWLLD